MQPTKLILESGKAFEGVMAHSFFAEGFAEGEVVFTTGMTGYPETLTDPSFRGQIVVFTYPLIGNYGVPSRDLWESSQIHPKGVVISTLAPFASHHQSIKSFSAWLEEEKIPLLMEVDTRALTRYLRHHGTLRGKIVGLDMDLPLMCETGETLVAQVSCKTPKIYGHGKKKIFAIDCGMKENILRSLLQEGEKIGGVTVIRVPYNYDLSKEEYDGLFVSNGPGDPMICSSTIEILANELKKNVPIFGICLGAQLMALAAGAKTMKLPFGHRGQNQPCLDLRSKKCYITSQNHGYAVVKESLPPEWSVSFVNLNDGSVEGIFHREKPHFAVQFHPEASPGPYDTEWLFTEFLSLL